MFWYPNEMKGGKTTHHKSVTDSLACSKRPLNRLNFHSHINIVISVVDHKKKVRPTPWWMKDSFMSALMVAKVASYLKESLGTRTIVLSSCRPSP
jgi:hypothetical protein